MSFLHSCFIESSDEAISWLEDTLGCGMILAYVENENDMWILFDHEFEGWQFVDSEVKSMILNSDNREINCLGNFPLFKAISAMRDDSDIYQWFYQGGDNDVWVRCDFYRWDKSNLVGHNWIKASLPELINYFKK